MALVAYSDESDYSGNESEEHGSSPVSKPQSQNDALEDTDIVDDVPTVATWNVTNIMNPEKITLNKIKTSNKLRLILPALSQFNDDDEDDEQIDMKERVKPSTNGTGLFALLPEPRKPTHLIPQRVAAKKRSCSSAPVIKKGKVASLPAIDNDSDEEHPIGADFFSLTDCPEAPAPSQISSLVPSSTPIPSIRLAANHVPQNSHCPLESPPEIMNPGPEFGPSPRNENLQGNEVSSSKLEGINEESLRRLAGHRDKGQLPVFIDISADDSLMSRDEWVTRTLCDEKPTRSYSRNKEGNPTQQQKRKHQITYLAHQAQEREQELRSAWGQNRFTKLQTQSKYGF